MKCTKCGSELKITDKFCGQCGQMVKIYCPECNTELSEGVKFCPFCGRPVLMEGNEAEESTVDIVLKAVGENKVKVIKIIREVTDWGLKESKDAADEVELGNEFMMCHVPITKAEKIIEKFKESGADAGLV